MNERDDFCILSLRSLSFIYDRCKLAARRNDGGSALIGYPEWRTSQ
jgi:hypothetical protein